MLAESGIAAFFPIRNKNLTQNESALAYLLSGEYTEHRVGQGEIVHKPDEH